MKAQIATYEHESNGLSIEVIAETPDEQRLLRAAIKFAHISDGHGQGSHGNSLYLTMFKQAGTCADKE